MDNLQFRSTEAPAHATDRLADAIIGRLENSAIFAEFDEDLRILVQDVRSDAIVLPHRGYSKAQALLIVLTKFSTFEEFERDVLAFGQACDTLRRWGVTVRGQAYPF